MGTLFVFFWLVLNYFTLVCCKHLEIMTKQLEKQIRSDINLELHKEKHALTRFCEIERFTSLNKKLTMEKTINTFSSNVLKFIADLSACWLD